MIILDTNVVSEPMRPKPNANVLAWLDEQIPSSLYLTSISLSELLAGIEIMPAGKRRTATAKTLNHYLETLFDTRILSFDRIAAKSYAAVIGAAKTSGKAIGVPDGQIAAIALVHGFTLVTRDTAPFIAAGVPIINPWI